MARPRHEHPTPAELEVLQVIWERGPCTVRAVMDVLKGRRPRAYTSVMSLLDVMYDKGLLARKSKGRAFLYSAKVARTKALSGMVRDLLDRVFDGSSAALVAHLLQQSNPTRKELDQIRKTIAEYQKQRDA